MADTSQQELTEPHTNGAVDGLTEEEKSKMRPADIDAVGHLFNLLYVVVVVVVEQSVNNYYSMFRTCEKWTEGRESSR